MAKRPRRQPKDNTETVEPVRTPQVYAGPCPKEGKNHPHPNTRVYKTDGRVRRCKCNDCGHTWKQTGPPAGADPEPELEVPAAEVRTDADTILDD